jgi:hypothetical protein
VEALFVLALIGVNFRVAALQIDRADNAGGAMSRTGKIDDVQILFLDEPV